MGHWRRRFLRQQGRGQAFFHQRQQGVKGGNKVSVASLKKSSREVSMDDTANSRSLNEGWRMEDTILWASLPSSLLGKEVLKQRDAAVLASVEALQEAAGAERLLKCLSAYSEIQATSSEDHETEALVDQFFRLQDDLSQSRLIVKSLAGNTQVNLSETPQKEPNEDALKLSCERKERAQLWIRTALASDFAMPTSLEKIVGHDNTPKGRSILQKLSKPKHNCGSSDHNKLEWSRGSLLCATSDLEISLQRESRALFHGYLDECLDDIKWRFSRERSDNIVGTMLQIRRVSNWIDLMAKKESSSCPDLEDPEFSTYGRIKNKIYRILLMHIDKTAMVWENMGAVLP
ncbi:hypothetical protein SAY87_018756 [Trapa incisa]|uniref:DUF6857 domain-containing protein n=1 Tax=Trapa incisa TaxID=236973 RepID=A0AAN7JYQ3_9MYRT|nr:hypothetical protein SAY87_018756 [Trapa incisa]